MMTDSSYTLIPVGTNFPSDLRATFDKVTEEHNRLGEAYGYLQEYSEFLLTATEPDVIEAAKSRFPDIEKVQNWVKENKDRIINQTERFRRRLNSEDDTIFTIREKGVLDAITEFRSSSPEVIAFGCVYGARHSFVKEASEIGIAVVEITPFGVK